MILAEPFDPLVYERGRELDGITYVAPSQNAADLLTSPGRGPSEAEELIEWMTRNEGAIVTVRRSQSGMRKRTKSRMTS